MHNMHELFLQNYMLSFDFSFLTIFPFMFQVCTYICEIATHLCLCPFKTTIELTCLQLKRIELNGEAQEDIRGGLIYSGALPCRTSRRFLKS